MIWQRYKASHSVYNKYVIKVYAISKSIHFDAEKRILRYLAGTLDYVILCNAEAAIFIGHNDSDWAGCHDDMKSILLMYFLMIMKFVHGLQKSKRW